MKTLLDVRTLHWSRNAVFRVPTRHAGDAFMRVAVDGHCASKNAVVEVDAARFLALWREKCSSHREIAAGDPTTWPGDYKYKDAVDGFSHGEGNPVPLAEVGCYMANIDIEVQRRKYLFFKETVVVGSESLPCLGFTNGITRTIWLLTQGADAFPVHCSLSEAALLQELAGVPGGWPWTLDELNRSGTTLT